MMARRGEVERGDKRRDEDTERGPGDVTGQRGRKALEDRVRVPPRLVEVVEEDVGKQTLRSFIFLAIISFREKNPSSFHSVFISVVNASRFNEPTPDGPRITDTCRRGRKAKGFRRFDLVNLFSVRRI